MVNVEHFFETARTRYEIHLKKDVRGESGPWTTDPIFQQWRFCNVHREHDKTTSWFREHIRIPMANRTKAEIAMATIIFRWFNRIETGERIKDLILGRWDANELRRRLQDVAPITTGAYMIKTPTGLNKLEGLIKCIEVAWDLVPSMAAGWGHSLEQANRQLEQVPFLGPFLAYEVITDLRWTRVLNTAPDIMTWTTAGPGCTRGLSWVVAGRLGHYVRTQDQQVMLELMRELLEMSRDPRYWPQDWEPWDMREPEMWACEYDKYMRAKSGQTLKRRYRA